MADKKFFENRGPFFLSKIIEITNSIVFQSDYKDILIEDIASLNLAKNKEISVFNNIKYTKELKNTNAYACFIEEKHVKYAKQDTILLINSNPYKAYSTIAKLFYDDQNFLGQISSQSLIDNTAIIGKNCHIEANVVIKANTKVGDNTVIKSNSYIGESVQIGDNCHISNNVTITHTIMGSNNIIHSGTVIGKPGFGFASDINGHHLLPQLGLVIIGNNVSIGSNSCIDRGSGNNTVISDNCMIDNLVQIGHNVKLGKNCVIVAMVGIAGSTILGDFVIVGGQVGISGHLDIGSYSKIAAGSGVTKNIKPKSTYGGYPAVKINDWHRQSIILKNLTQKANN